MLNSNLALAGLLDQAGAMNLYAGSSAVNPINGQLLGPANLKAASLSLPWRSTTFTPAASWIRGDTGPAPHSVGCVALIDHNLGGRTTAYDGTVTPSGQWRFRSLGRNGAGGNPIIAQAAPLSILASTNLTGTVAAIQDTDPENPDAAWLTATSGGSNTSLRVGFQNPTGINLGTAPIIDNNAGLLPIAQIFYVTLRRTSGGGGTSPTVTFTLYESGTSRAVLTGGGSVASTTGTTWVVYWTGASLSSAIDDGRVQLQIDGTAVGGNTVEVGAVAWQREFATGGSYTYADSGWLPVTIPASYGNYPGILTESFFPAPATNMDSWWIDLQDPLNTSGYFQVGRLIVSTAQTFTVGVDYNHGITWKDLTTVTRSKGGSPFAYRGAKYREWTGKLTALIEAEAFPVVLDQLDRQKGLSGNFLISIMPDNAANLYMRTFYAKLKSIDPVAQWTVDHWERTLNVEEIVR